MRRNKLLKRDLRQPSPIETLESRTLLSSGPQVIGYLPDYEFSQFSKVDLGALSQLNYFSVVASSSGSLGTTSASGYSFSQLQTVVAAAHSAPSRVNVSIVIDPSSQFQTIANSASITNTFVTNVMNFISTYGLDGVDLDYEPGTLTAAQKTSWGNLLAALHAQTSSHGLILSEAVQASQLIIPSADFPDVDRFLMMDYDLEYNSSAPYSDSLAYLNNWVGYGVPKSELYMGIPFYGRSGTSWSNSTTETYAQIIAGYQAANGGVMPSPNLDTLTINGTTWGFNGVTTVQNKANYMLSNGFGGVMIWELGQDTFTGSSYNTASLLPAIKSSFAAAWETWTGSSSSDWSTAANWKYGTVPGGSTNVVINSGNIAAASPITVASLTLNGGKLALPEGTSTVQSLSIGGNGALDVGYGTLMINYGSNADPISTIHGYIATGYAGGAWNGVGIMSSGAAINSASYGLGYADSADTGNPAGLPAGTIEVRYTLLGDANLDGTVNGVDFGIVAADFNLGVSNWDQGDFNYDGTVNGVDFGDLSANFNKGVSLPAIQNVTTTTPSVNVSSTNHEANQSSAKHHGKRR